VLDVPVARIIGSSVGLIAFAVAILAGLLVGNPADAIIQRALVSMVACCVGGFLVGLVCEHVVRGELRKIDAGAESVRAKDAEDDAEEDKHDDEGEDAEGDVDVVEENRSSAGSAPQTASAAVSTSRTASGRAGERAAA
jgi:hypothetical protein